MFSQKSDNSYKFCATEDSWILQLEDIIKRLSDWDKGGTPEHIYQFNKQWLSLCRSKLKDNGTIWISGTHHNIFVVQRCLQELGYKILNVITWQKSDPPPNLSCRYFNFSTELVIWARKHEKKPHLSNPFYEVFSPKM